MAKNMAKKKKSTSASKTKTKIRFEIIPIEHVPVEKPAKRQTKGRAAL
jgi:hypothetical protein